MNGTLTALSSIESQSNNSSKSVAERESQVPPQPLLQVFEGKKSKWLQERLVVVVVGDVLEVLARHHRPYLVRLGPVLLLELATKRIVAGGHIWQLACCWQQTAVTR